MTNRKKIINAIDSLDEKEKMFIVNNIIKNEKYKDLYKRFSRLSNFSKIAILDELSEIIEDYERNDLFDVKENLCNVFGHDFTPWEIDTFYKEEDALVNGEYIKDHKIEQRIYKRRCKRCNFSQATRQMPEDIDEEYVGISRVKRQL